MIVCWAGDGLGELLNCLPKNDDLKWLSSTIKTCQKMMIRCDYHQPSKLGRLFHGSVVVYDPTSYWCAQKHLFLSYGINGCLCPPLPCRARPRAHNCCGLVLHVPCGCGAALFCSFGCVACDETACHASMEIGGCACALWALSLLGSVWGTSPSYSRLIESAFIDQLN